jgi:hypothetical protein
VEVLSLTNTQQVEVLSLTNTQQVEVLSLTNTQQVEVLSLTNADNFEALVLRQLGFDGNQLARQFIHRGVGGRDEKDARHLRLVLGVAARAPHLQHHAHNGGGLPGARGPLHQS